jgi:pyruvate/2-oxoglutarate dehydrogenase complex dihydrolipoamide dehydrogenase (E3) component
MSSATPHQPAASVEDSVVDVVVIGTGSGGKIAALELARRGQSVVAVEAHRVGGECPYIACVPAKSLLFAAAAGLTWAQAVERRDEVTGHRDDTSAANSLSEEGIQLVRGHGRLEGRAENGRHQVRVTTADGSDRVFSAAIVVLGPGSSPGWPPIDGLHTVPTWTSDQALSTLAQPARLLVLGGGAVGCELSQAFSRLGTAVTLVELAARLLPGEAPWVGELVAEQLSADRVEVIVGAHAEQAEPMDGSGVRLYLGGGQTIEGDRLLVAGGRTPNSANIGLAAAGGALDDGGSILIDARCRVLDEDGVHVPGLFAVGDVTAESSYTHSANYQARIIAAQVAGQGRDADYSAIPRAVYTDPVVFCVGLTPQQAQQRGVEVRSASFDASEVERASLLATSIAAPGRRVVRGRVEVLADARTGVVVGASCVGPDADSWGAELALAVRARLDVDLLAQHVRAFPTWSEAIYPVACDLAAQLS